MSDGPSILLDSARTYLARGYAVIPVPARKKIPVLKGWTDLRLSESELLAHFNGTGNIGVLLGEPSGWLVDVDLDCEEAVALAPKFLPPTGAMSGRPGKPASHWWYVCNGMKTRKTELLFLALILRMLKLGGRAAVIVPDGVLFGSSNAHTDLRKALIDGNQLEGIIKLPAGVFKPYAGVSTAIVIFTKGGKTKDVFFYDVQADGFSLDDKRDPLPPAENDLPEVRARWAKRNPKKDSDRKAKHFFVGVEDIRTAEYASRKPHFVTIRCRRKSHAQRGLGVGLDELVPGRLAALRTGWQPRIL